MCAHAEYTTFGRTGGIGRVSMQNLLLLAELKVSGMCPCRIYYFWQHWGHWACAHAEFITFGRIEGIGHVSMQNVLLLAQLKVFGMCPCRIYYFWQHWGHWACAHAEVITFGRTEGIGRESMQNCFTLRRAEGIGHVSIFCTERRLLWLARPGRKALARQAFLGRGGSPKSSSIAG